MTNAAITNLFEQSQSVLAPMTKMNKLAVGNLEKLVSLQMDALQAYVDLGMKQLKAAVEISNPNEAHSFMNNQIEVAGIMRKRVLEDAKAFADLGANYKDELSKLTEKNVTEFTQKASQAVEAS